MNGEFSDYGLWSLVAINSLIFIVFAYSFTRPKSARDWRAFGAFSAFLVALFTEMYGFPLTIYLFSGWLSSRFPGVNWFAHDSGHLLEMLFGWGGNPHIGPFHSLSAVFILGGLILLALAWRVVYRAQRSHTVAMTGLYAMVRHPQYVAFISIMFGFLLQWPTLPTLVMFPILVYMYLQLARREERDALADLGEEYRIYRDRTPAFLPRFGDTLKLGAVGWFILTLPMVVANVAMTDRTISADAQLPETPVSRSQAEHHDIDRQRIQVDALRNQFRDLAGTADPEVLRDLVRAHLAAVRGIGAALHGVNLSLLEDLDNGRITGNPVIKQRLQLDTDFIDVQLQMLEAATQTGTKK